MLKSTIILTAGILAASFSTASAGTPGTVCQHLNIGGSRSINIVVQKDVAASPYSVTGSREDRLRAEPVFLSTRSVTVRTVTGR